MRLKSNCYLPSLHQIRTIAVACFLFTAIVLLFSCAAQSRNKDVLTHEISNAFASGALITDNYVNTDHRRGKYIFNDCLILQILLIKKDSLFSDVVTSHILKDKVAEPCATLKRAVTNGPHSFDTYAYSRYFWGAKALVGLALPFASIDSIKFFLSLLVYIVLLCAAGISIFRFFSKLNSAPSSPVTIFVIVICLLTLYDLRDFSVTFSHGFSELVIAIYLLYSAIWPGKLLTNHDGTPWRLILFGAFTAWFELLTGPMVMAIGLAVLVEHAHAVDRTKAIARAFRVGFTVALSVIFTLLWLQFFVALFGDSRNVLQFIYHLLLRMQVHLIFDVPVEKSWQIKENMHNYTPTEVVNAVLDCMKLLTYDNAAAAKWLFLCSLVCLSVCVIVAKFERFYFQLIAVYGLVFFFLIVWYFVFSNHTAIHAFMMVRPLVLLPICAVLALYHLLMSWNGNAWRFRHFEVGASGSGDRGGFTVHRRSLVARKLKHSQDTGVKTGIPWLR